MTINTSPGAGLSGPASGQSNHAGGWVPQDRIVRKETALGVVRELVPPTAHIGLTTFAPFKDVATDEVIFDYVKGLTDGLAPARAEDAESELAQKDDVAAGQGRASVIDWALKDHYTASDVNRYREFLRITQEMTDTQSLNFTVNSVLEDWAAKVARHTALRRRKLDNRLEWLIMSAMSAGVIAYNDGKIKFTVDYGRPSDQQAQAPASGTYASTTHDPIGDILKVQQLMYDRYGIIIKNVMASRKFFNTIINADKFAARSGLVVSNGSGGIATPDVNYVLDGWGPNAALQVVSNATGVKFIEYDAVYRTRPLGSNTVTNNRFFPQNRVLFWPEESEINDIDDTGLGFGKTLTSPHPMGNWGTGFYEWERETIDPWGYDIGTGIKAFPVFLHMDYTYTWDVTLP